ncbi:pyridoxal 5'-phosphate synthase [Malassezia nana]|uniref:Pyridoxal 5'-phosphate synthase n=1 Tax=Malassezia nana TaxID=180528 RepID=A0AAF0EMH6_9BASI|nr:pyridoxal 5'-phosphate synthase [Malassezia nana]
MWRRELCGALEPGDRSAFFYALATITNGSKFAPRVRYVVHRGFLGDTDCLLTTTDVRSDKGQQMGLGQRVPVELAWYIASNRKQFRIRGQAFLVGCNDATGTIASPRTTGFWPAAQDWTAERKRMWDHLSPEMRRTFFGQAPGSFLLQTAQTDTEQSAEQLDHVSANFALLVVEPEEVDQLDLKAFQRTIYTRQSTGVWMQRQVAP